MTGLLGMGDLNTEEITGKLDAILPIIKTLNEQFKNPVSFS